MRSFYRTVDEEIHRDMQETFTFETKTRTQLLSLRQFDY